MGEFTHGEGVSNGMGARPGAQALTTTGEGGTHNCREGRGASYLVEGGGAFASGVDGVELLRVGFNLETHPANHQLD